MSHRDDDDKVNDLVVFDLTNVKVIEWCSKDRTVATLRMSDRAGMCDMKIYLTLKSKVEQMENYLNMQAGNDEHH